MLKILDKELFDPSILIEKMRSKNNTFDYQTEESFIMNCKSDNSIIFYSEHAVIPCVLDVYPTGLKTLTVHVVRLTEGDSVLGHLRDCLDSIEAFSKDMGIDRIILEGRKANIRIYSDYEFESVKLYKKLGE